MRIAFRPYARNTQSIDDRIMPLINIVFLLLIFFIVAGVMREPAPFEIDAPEASSETVIEKPELTIFVAEDGRIAVGEQRVARAGLGELVAPMLAEAPDRRIRIAADEKAEAVEVIAVMETLRSLGAERVRLTTRLKAGA